MKKLLLSTVLVGILFIANSIVLSNPLGKIEKINDYGNLIENETVKGDGKTDYWALLVGVGVYADNPIENIPSMLEEVDDMYEVLLDSSFWSADHIKIIKGENATVMNIIKGLRWLDRMDDSDDISLIYFTTHGSHLKLDIPPRDEEDGTDECLLSYWGIVYLGKPIGIIWDDELNFFLNRLDSKGVCLIVDSCFAGGFDDPPNWRRNRERILPSTVSSYQTARNWMKGFGKELRGQGRVVVMSCREEEVSWAPMFSPFMIDGLRGFADTNSNDIVSAEELFLYTEPRCYWQQPTIYDDYEGELPLIQVNDIITKDNSYKTKNFRIYIREEKTNFLNHSSKNTVVCGYVTDAVTTNPIEDVRVELNWFDGAGHDDYNCTFTDSTGFFSINTLAGFVFLGFNIDGYLYQETEMYEINENEILWINASLDKIPPENAVLCGYIKDSHTHQPIKGANIYVKWLNNEGDLYRNSTDSDSSGFYILNISAGEVYHEVWKHEYLYEISYRHDVEDGKPLWINFSLDPENISVYIKKPINAVYRNNERLIPFTNPLILRDIEIEAFAHDYWYNPWDNIDKVEFYIDGILRSTVTSEPYKWMWNEKTPFRFKHKIKVIAYDGDNSAVDEKEVFKI